MEVGEETAAVVALLRAGRRAWATYERALARGDSPHRLLEEELGMFAPEARERAQAEIAAWRAHGIAVLSGDDRAYPAALRRAPGRPPLIFARGRVELLADPGVAVVGSRQASDRGRSTATTVAERLVGAGLTVVSGLAAGIDTAAHLAALDCGGPTIAVLGTGVDRCYPAENRSLQERIAREGVVISRFWPDAAPSRRAFPMRNAVMAGMTAATIIVEASPTSGTRIQARMSLAAGRKVLLLRALLEQPWARELAERPGVEVFGTPGQLEAIVERMVAESPAPQIPLVA